MRNKIGSNQHKAKYKGLTNGCKKSVLYLLTIILIIAFMGFNAQLEVNKVKAKIISPLALSPAVFTKQYIQPQLASLSEREKSIAVIRKVWGKDWKVGITIATCESGLRTEAKHVNSDGSTDSSLFQINSIHGIDVSDPVANTLFAYKMWQEQGLQPWASSNKCHHLLDKNI